MRSSSAYPRIALRAHLAILILLGLALMADGATAPPVAPRLQQADRLLTQAQQHPGDAARLTQQARALVPTDASPALRQAQAHPDANHLAAARRELGILQQATVASTPAAHTDAQARAALKGVLARREFGGLKSVSTSQMDKFFKWLHDVSEKFGKAFGRFFEWLSRWLPRIKPIHVPNLSPATKAGKALVYTVYALGIAAVILLLGWVVSKLVTARHRQAPTSRGEADAHPGIKRKNEPTYWDRALKHAEELWQQGDQREALRTLQQACLVLLDARGVLRYDDSRANGEVLYELKRTGRATVHDALRPVFRCFDRSWYGFLEVSSDEFTRVLENSRQFRLAVVEEA